MKLTFTEQGHLYQSDCGTKWTSVSSAIHHFKEPFDKFAKAQSSSTRKPGRYPNKWYGLSIEEILAAWDGENKRSVELGKWYHDLREQQLYQDTSKIVHKPIIEDGIKVAPEQKLTEGIYPEHLVYLQSAGICGQSDYVEVLDNTLYIRDYKTNKEIKRQGFTNWEGTKMLLKPLQHLDDCEFNIYAIQLSLYMYMILRHNPLLKPGPIVIEHVTFEQEGLDKYGYPIYKRDEQGNFIVAGVEAIEVPYLIREVKLIIDHLKEPKL